MSEETPNRLQEFRSQYGPARKWGVLPYAQLVLTAAGFVVIALLVLSGRNRQPGPTPGGGGMSLDAQRRYAAYLEGKSEPMAAARAYEAYMDTAALSPQERAKVAYSAAKLSIDAERYDEALPYLYQAEFLDPESSLKEEINKKVVLAWTSLGGGQTCVTSCGNGRISSGPRRMSRPGKPCWRSLPARC
jgi:hypothetical protein